MSINKQLKIGDLTAKLPIIQGGMGVGVSRSSLAGAVAKEGGVGIISTAQIGYDEEGFEKDQAACNNRAIHKHIKRAKEIAQGNGLVGVNIMVALKHYAEHVKEAVAAGADVIISGAGLPMNLPELVSETCRTKIAPIVSSKRAAQLILKMWAHKYDRTADFLVVEGPKAGGHLGFSREQLDEIDTMDYDEEIRQMGESSTERILITHWNLEQTESRLRAGSWQQKNVMRQRRINRPISMQKKRMSRLSKVRLECRGVLFAMH